MGETTRRVGATDLKARLHDGGEACPQSFERRTPHIEIGLRGPLSGRSEQPWGRSRSVGSSCAR